jgi:hypothetical protein
MMRTALPLVFALVAALAAQPSSDAAGAKTKAQISKRRRSTRGKASDKAARKAGRRAKRRKRKLKRLAAEVALQKRTAEDFSRGTESVKGAKLRTSARSFEVWRQLLKTRKVKDLFGKRHLTAADKLMRIGARASIAQAEVADYEEANAIDPDNPATHTSEYRRLKSVERATKRLLAKQRKKVNRFDSGRNAELDKLLALATSQLKSENKVKRAERAERLSQKRVRVAARRLRQRIAKRERMEQAYLSERGQRRVPGARAGSQRYALSRMRGFQEKAALSREQVARSKYQRKLLRLPSMQARFGRELTTDVAEYVQLQEAAHERRAELNDFRVASPRIDRTNEQEWRALQESAEAADKASQNFYRGLVEKHYVRDVAQVTLHLLDREQVDLGQKKNTRPRE